MKWQQATHISSTFINENLRKKNCDAERVYIGDICIGNVKSGAII